MATHSRILTWIVPWTEEPGGLHPVQKVTKELDFLLHSYTIQLFPTLISRPNSPQPGMDSSDDSSCGQYASGLSELGQEHLLPSSLGPLNSTGQRTKLAETRETRVRMAVQSNNLPANPTFQSYLQLCCFPFQPLVGEIILLPAR